jgi:hypothetical protein
MFGALRCFSQNAQLVDVQIAMHLDRIFNFREAFICFLVSGAVLTFGQIPVTSIKLCVVDEEHANQVQTVCAEKEPLASFAVPSNQVRGLHVVIMVHAQKMAHAHANPDGVVLSVKLTTDVEVAAPVNVLHTTLCYHSLMHCRLTTRIILIHSIQISWNFLVTFDAAMI